MPKVRTKNQNIYDKDKLIKTVWQISKKNINDINMSKKSTQQREIAKNRIKFLFQHAEEVFKEDSNLSDRYVKIARRIAMKYKIRLPSSLKKRFCKHCHKYLVPSVNCRIRIHKHRLIYYCLSCKHYMRHPIK